MTFNEDLEYCKTIEKIVQYFITGKLDAYYKRDYERDTECETHNYDGHNVNWDSTIFYLTNDGDRESEFSFEKYEFITFIPNVDPITDKGDGSNDSIDIPIEDDMTEEKYFQYSTVYTAQQLRGITLFWYFNKNNSPGFYLDTEFISDYVNYMKKADNEL